MSDRLLSESSFTSGRDATLLLTSDLYADYDRIEKGAPEENTGLPSVRYVKEFPDGMLYGVDVVVEKDKIMRYKTGWKKKL